MNILSWARRPQILDVRQTGSGPESLVPLNAAVGLATGAPDEGSGPAARPGPFAAHEWEPSLGSVSLGPWPLSPTVTGSES
jgi:hypothetical protein